MDKKKHISDGIKKVHKHISPALERAHKIGHKVHRHTKRIPTMAWIYGIAGLALISITGIIVWGVILQIPDIESFDTRKVVQSIDLYDREGKKLYSTGGDVNRIVIDSPNISPDIKNAVVAIEDSRFYTHKGVVVVSTMRAVFLTVMTKLGLRSGSIQGGSTITQQVIKNALLTTDQTAVRKMKEWILALKIEKRYTKDQILTIYLNEAPYGGRMYGIRTATEAFFGKEPKDVTLAEAAYLAAIPNAPSYLSPYGKHVDALEIRKNYVLLRMKELGMITENQYQAAKSEAVAFLERGDQSSHAIHFVEYVMSTLPDIIDESVIERGGLKVYTTLDLELQDKAEKIIRDHALAAEKEWNASNAALVALDPKNGDIISMVGSRGYSDPDIDGKYNVAIAKRQPGSAFKPIIYATAFEQGFTPDTAIFDTKTQFSTDCPVASMADTAPCYSPSNYDGLYKGPMQLRNALAESRNVPAVKLFYMVGIQNALNKAKAAGISTLTDANRYGLTLVLGGGEVTLLDLTSAYGSFANDGTHVEPRAVTRVEDENGTVIATVESKGDPVYSPEAVRQLNDVLSDNVARTPLFGAQSGLYFANTPVAAKTGTTNSNKDAWLIGYTPNLVVGVWSGNNNNTSMKKGSSINIKPWRQYFDASFAKIPYTSFIAPAPVSINAKPILRGVWQGGDTFTIDTISGGLATDLTPDETKKTFVASPNPHDILHWIDRGNVAGAAPSNPASDNQYARFEYGAQLWINQHPEAVQTTQKPTFSDNIHTQSNMPKIEEFDCDMVGSVARCEATVEHEFNLASFTATINGIKALSQMPTGDTFSFEIPVSDFIESAAGNAEIGLTVVDTVFNKATETVLVTL